MIEIAAEIAWLTQDQIAEPRAAPNWVASRRSNRTLGFAVGRR